MELLSARLERHVHVPPDQIKAIHVYTDASGRYGGAAVIPFTNWFQCMWPQSWATTGIAVKELVPVGSRQLFGVPDGQAGMS